MFSSCPLWLIKSVFHLSEFGFEFNHRDLFKKNSTPCYQGIGVHLFFFYKYNRVRKKVYNIIHICPKR